MSTAQAKGKVTAEGVTREAWSVREFAAALGASVHTIYRLCNSGQLAWFQLAGEKRIPDSEMKRLMAEAYERVVAS